MLKSGGLGPFRFRVDGELVFYWDSWDGERDLGWFLVAIPVGTGTHTLEWSYEYDGFGEDHAWIDAIRFPRAND